MTVLSFIDVITEAIYHLVKFIVAILLYKSYYLNCLCQFKYLNWHKQFRHLKTNFFSALNVDYFQSLLL